MKSFQISLLVFACILCNKAFSQQITIDNSISPQQLIENNLIQGCVETSNIASPINGSINGFSSFGYFERANSNFPFENGIVLTTGNANSGGNVANGAVLNEGASNWSSDADLETALGISNTVNATAIEFDFSSISNQIQFNYILASEEYYGNFPCDYSDGFAFLIKQAGTSDPYTNIALIPGTTTPVNTNTIHDEIVGFCAASNGQYFDGYSLGDTNYNGRTTVMTATASIIPNVTYHIKLVIADQTDKNYDSAVFIEGNSFNASVDLGDNITTCADQLTLNGNIDNPLATYSWFLNDAPISGQMQPTLSVTQSGTYTVSIDIPISNSSCTIEDTIVVALSSTQTATPIADFELCDDTSSDGIETFDLATRTSEVLNSVPNSNYNISYHLSNADALNNSNTIMAPIQNSVNPQAVYVRIEDTVNGCLAYSSFNLVVNTLPNFTPPTDLIVCDDDTTDGFTATDLTQKNDEITNGNPQLNVSYYHSLDDANARRNSISSPYTNSAENEQLFVRVENSQTGCFSTTTLNLTVLDKPAINTINHYIDGCDPQHDGYTSFDLTAIIDDVLAGLTGVSTSFHELYEDALSGSNAISDSSNYTNITQDVQTLYIRVTDDVTGCASVAPIEIHTNLLLTGTIIQDFSVCNDDEETPSFDLSNIEQVIINELPDVTVTFYETIADQNSQNNALNPSQRYIPTDYPKTLYITLDNNTCTELSEIQLLLNPIVEFPSIGAVDYCDTDQDGFTSIDLSMFSTAVYDGQDGYIVRYFATESDAKANTNALPNFYTNVSNPQTIYTRTISEVTGCADVKHFLINVLPAPETSTPSDIIICDNDQDGFSLIDLNQKISEITSDTTNRTISFHNSREKAESNTDAISNSSSYNANTQSIYIRVENSQTGCYTVERLKIVVNTLPVFTNISDYIYCEPISDGFGEFIFQTKDSEILNGQSNKRTSYYLNQNDADNKLNALNKTAVYQNVSNPQTIFVRVENISDVSCYGTTSFTIEVGTSPEFNEPTDWFVCDDIANDSRELFDLTEKISEISSGINDQLDITFYTTYANAQNAIAPVALQYENTTNPQRIYARIDNGTICTSVASFSLNVIKAPDANPSQPLEICDFDGDGAATFNLRLAEVDILDVRQDNLEIAYYANAEDSESETNPITTPESYTNISNPQTAYVRITNTISNCYLSIPIELIVNLPPTFNAVNSIAICENDANYFDLLEINSQLIDDATNVNISYFASQNDAINNDNVLPSDYSYQTVSDTIYVRLENTITNCFTTHSLQLQVNPLPTAHTPSDLESCDDDFDGLFTFDLSQQNATILGGQNPNNFTITFHESSDAANSGTNALNTLYAAEDLQTIFARIENNATGCYNMTQFQTYVHPRPILDVGDQVICLDNLPLLVSANTNTVDDSYLWSTNETTPEIEISEIGTYWVKVTTIFGCETTEVFNVIESEAATIEFTETVDFSDPNNITVTISGIGNYLYVLDDNEPQESNVFENVPIGAHIVTIIDLNGCAEITKEVIVLDTPKFMTPNDDGYFDTWHITGVETLPGTVIYIYDRYGKQLAYLTATSKGWDGTHNGEKMPSTDYWFVADVKKDNVSFQLKGHFALRR